jgi:hypothetical protein
MNKHVVNFYNSLVVLPDRVYPFRTEIEGQWVRGIRSYNATLNYMQRIYGHGHYGYKLSIYRQFFHAVSSILIMIVATILLQYYVGSTVALYVFLAVGVLFISYQEFFLQRRTYQQLWRKGILDWLSWCVPAGLYMISHFH